MGRLDLKRLREAEKELDEKYSGGENTLFINRTMLDEPREFRILEPHPSMGGLYFIEVYSYWIDSVKVYSNEFLGEECTIASCINWALKEDTKNAAEIKKLLNAKKDGKMLRVKRDVEFWIPGLLMEFEEKNGQLISDIFDKDGNYDVNKIEPFIVDGHVKILQAPITLIRAINKIASTRGGEHITDQFKGFNLMISRTKTKGKVNYNVVSLQEVMPMPEKFYDIDNMLDPVKLVKSMMMDNEYQESIIYNYLYGEEKLEKDDHYRFPKLRDEISEMFKEKDEERKPSRRPRPTREEPEREESAETEEREEPSNKRGRRDDEEGTSQEEERPVTRGRGRPSSSSVSQSHRRPVTTDEAEPPTTSRRGRGRSVVDDYNDE